MGPPPSRGQANTVLDRMSEPDNIEIPFLKYTSHEMPDGTTGSNTQSDRRETEPPVTPFEEAQPCRFPPFLN